jgi:hypothetical protein
MERLRDQAENCLIDDMVEWSMWHYATSESSCLVTVIVTQVLLSVREYVVAEEFPNLRLNIFLTGPANLY